MMKRRASLAIFSRKNSAPADILKRSQSIATPTLHPVPSSIFEPEADVHHPRSAFRILDLPTELQVQVFCLLSCQDILNLRLTSKHFLQLLKENQHPIVYKLWTFHFPTGDLPCLCPSKPNFVSASNVPLGPSFGQYFQFLRRDHAVAKLAGSMSAFVEAKIFRISLQHGHDWDVVGRLRLALNDIDGMRWNMVGRLRLALMHLHCYWEDYRYQLESDIRANAATDEIPRQRKILDKFCVPCLLECYGVYELLFLALSMKFRPKTYAGSIERFARRWRGDPAPIGELVMLFMYGGFEVIDYLIRLKPYAARRAALSRFVESLTSGRQAHAKSKEEPWWLKFRLEQTNISTVSVGEPQADLAMRQAVFKYVSSFSAGHIFQGWEERLYEERKDPEKRLMGGWDFAFFAMLEPPTGLDYQKIQQDWSRYYGGDEQEEVDNL